MVAWNPHPSKPEGTQSEDTTPEVTNSEEPATELSGPEDLTPINPGEGSPEPVNSEPFTSEPVACSVPDLNRWVDDSMKDYYLFYDQVPTLNLANYNSPEELIEALRFEERDPYSNVSDAVTQTTLFSEGRVFGLGVDFARTTSGDVAIASVYDDSPMGRAGVKRGDIITSLNGVVAAELNNAVFQAALGTFTDPKVATFEFLRPFAYFLNHPPQS